MAGGQTPLDYEVPKHDREPPDYWVLALVLGVCLLGLGGILLLRYLGK